MTEWETEFAEGVSERLDKFGSAFADPEKGGRGEALSYAQKKVVSSLKKKAAGKDERGGDDKDYPKRSSFKSKKPKFTPRVRQLDEDFDDEPPQLPKAPAKPEAPPVKGKPFLRIVRND